MDRSGPSTNSTMANSNSSIPLDRLDGQRHCICCRGYHILRHSSIRNHHQRRLISHRTSTLSKCLLVSVLFVEYDDRHWSNSIGSDWTNSCDYYIVGFAVSELVLGIYDEIN